MEPNGRYRTDEEVARLLGCCIYEEIRMDAFKDISMDVRQLVSINEKLHTSVLRGSMLNQDELDLVRQCATQLLDFAQRTGEREQVVYPSPSTDTCNQL